MWPTPASSRYNVPPEMGMFVVAPATSFHHHQHQQHHHHPESLIPGAVDASGINNSHHPNSATALGIGVIPLLTATPCVDGEDLMNRNRAGTIHLWQQAQQLQQQQQQQHDQMNQSYPNTNSSNKKTISFHHHDPTNITAVNLLQPSTSSGGGAATCQDCGNQAKKDCSHRRCRTCCRSRGFDCNTHVKSTWVPAARRRERQMIVGAPGTGGGGGGGGGGASSGSTSGAKKPRLISSQNTTATTSHTSTSNTPPRSFDTSSSHHQEGSFKETLPGQVRAPAVFKCVRVTAVEDGEDEYAYQAVVRIGGHVFKGFLYDQGLEPREGFPNMSELNLGGGGGNSGAGGGGDGGGGRNGVSSSLPLLDPSDVYGAAGAGGLIGGSSYGNTIN